MRLSRQCYDKFWRCPGWAGGGFRWARVTRCPSGSLLVPGVRTERGMREGVDEHMPDDRWWAWKFHRCNRGCGVVALPYVTRWIDPSWLWHVAKGLPARVADEWQAWRERRRVTRSLRQRS